MLFNLNPTNLQRLVMAKSNARISTDGSKKDFVVLAHITALCQGFVTLLQLPLPSITRKGHYST